MNASDVGVRVESIGRYLPTRVVTAAEIGALVGVTEDWVVSRAGVAERRWADGETPLEMAVAASLDAMDRTSHAIEDVDLIIYASATPHQMIPDTATLLQRELGLGMTGVKAFSVHSTCMSFLMAFDIAASYFASGRHQKALIVSAEIGSAGVNPSEPESASLLGDMATAVLVVNEPESTSSLKSLVLKTYGDGADLCRMEAGFAKHPLKHDTVPEDYMFHMDGRGVFAMAYQLFPPVIVEALQLASVELSDVALVIPHQASLLAIRSIQRALGFDDDRVVVNIDRVGNCVAASLPGAMFHAIEEDRLKRGDTVLLAGTGAGLSLGAAVLVF